MTPFGLGPPYFNPEKDPYWNESPMRKALREAQEQIRREAEEQLRLDSSVLFLFGQNLLPPLPMFTFIDGKPLGQQPIVNAGPSAIKPPTPNNPLLMEALSIADKRWAFHDWLRGLGPKPADLA